VADDPATDPRIIEEATNLYSELQKTSQPNNPSSAAADEIEAAFNERMRHMATVDEQLRNARRLIKALEKQCPAEKEKIRDEALL
jgi:hypothetical protein